MAGKKTNTKTSRVVGSTNGRHSKRSAASALAQAPVKRSDRTETSRSRSGQSSSADELGLRAWWTTYRNSKGKDA